MEIFVDLKILYYILYIIYSDIKILLLLTIYYCVIIIIIIIIIMNSIDLYIIIMHTNLKVFSLKFTALEHAVLLQFSLIFVTKIITQY